jgi:hypothetical protein|tara:strand:+ start:3341 stop:5650 length:2310 start_codon:yes stop_codon:yes gene_type:complete
MELKIQRFKDLASVITEKDELRRRHSEWTDRQKELRNFYNGRPIMTEDEADEENIEEITNHLIGFSNMQVHETRMYSMWSTSNKLIDVNVTEGEIEDREKSSEWINKYLNRAIYNTTRFGAYWRAVCGEISMAGRVACVHKEDSDWCPSVVPKILLPDSVGTDSSELTYAFAPKELTYAQLEAMLTTESEVSGESEDEIEEDEDSVEDQVFINEKIVRQLMDTIDNQIENNDSQMNTGSESELPEASNTDSVERSNKTTVNLWYYYEVRFDETKDHKVVDLLIFTDEFRNKDAEPDAEDAGVYEQVAHYPAYYESPSQWMHLIVIDSSIGGDKRFSTAKGIAEITYNSDIDSEELLNSIFSGEKMRATPRFQQGAEANEDKLLGWNPVESTLVPGGITEFQFKGGTGGLQNPLSLLRQNSSAQSGAGHSNSGRDGELRQQAVERQGNSQATTTSRTSDLHKSMEIIAREIVRRFFVGKVEGGSPGYEEIMWFRKQMDKKSIDLEMLAEQSFGFYDNIEVKIVKSSSSGEIDHDLAVAVRLMENLSNYPAAVRPFIIRRFTTLITGDPDFSDQLVELLPRINSAQRVTAESEFEQIARDASIGEETPLGMDDVHPEHARTHNKHLLVIINKALLRPWTREDAAHFAGVQIHQQLHLDELMSNDTTRAEGEQFLRQFEDLVSEGDKLLSKVSREELEEEGKSEMEIERQLKIEEQQRKGRETEIKASDTASVIKQREERSRDGKRKSNQEFLLRKEQMDRKERQDDKPQQS